MELLVQQLELEVHISASVHLVIQELIVKYVTNKNIFNYKISIII